MIQTILNVDYDSHPAFSKYSKGSDFDPSKLVGVIEDLRQLMVRTDEPSRIDEIYQTKFEPAVNNLKQALSERTPNTPILKAALDALDLAAKEIRSQSHYLSGRNIKHSYSKNIADMKVAEDLKSNKISIGRISTESIDQALKEHSADLELLFEKSKTKQMGYRDVVLNLKTTSMRNMVRELSKIGLVNGAKQFLGYDLEPLYASLALSKPEDNWYKNCYQDDGLETSPFSYFHIDADYDLVKIIVYLDDVTTKNGPFTFLKEVSDYMDFLSRYYRFLDFEVRKYYQPSVNTQYYRAWYLSDDFKRDFMTLPHALRGTSHFGDDILKGSKTAQYMEPNIKEVVGPKGTAFAFFGGNLIHRGGMIEEGQRLAIQFGFRMRTPLHFKVANKLKRMFFRDKK